MKTYHTPGQQGIRAAKAEGSLEQDAMPNPKRMREALRSCRLALEHQRHWQPTMAAHLIEIIDTALES